MFGRGVISTHYAWAFEKAGHTVEFFVRKGRKTEFGPTVSLNHTASAFLGACSGVSERLSSIPFHRERRIPRSCGVLQCL
jgi:hypothetical protein